MNIKLTNTLRQIALLCIVAAPLTAHASITIGAQIAYVRVDTSGNAMVGLTTNTGSSPGCASGYPKELAFSVSTDGGKASLSALLAAKLAGKPVNIYGTGTCTNGYGTIIETLSYVEVR